MYLHSGMLLSNKNVQITTIYGMVGSHKPNVEIKKPKRKRVMYMNFMSLNISKTMMLEFKVVASMKNDWNRVSTVLVMFWGFFLLF